MACLAIGNGMNPGEGKPSFGMKVKHFLVTFPAIGSMAGLAVAAKLSTVNIGMAVRTFAAHPGKMQILVAGDALHPAMGTGQWETGVIMGKLHGTAHFIP